MSSEEALHSRRGPARSVESAGTGEPVVVLAVAGASGLDDLRRILGHSRWTVRSAVTLAQAAGILAERAALVVICEAELPDGTWRQLLERTQNASPRPPLVVVSRERDDRLWKEVVDAGAYDLLARPLEEREVYRVVSMAWRNLQHRVTARSAAS